MAFGKLQQVYVESSEFKPKKDNILVKPIELKHEKVTETGLVVQVNTNRSVTDRPTMGTVIAIGDDVKDIKEGDIVFWPITDGLDFEFNDGVFILLRYESIIGIKKYK